MRKTDEIIIRGLRVLCCVGVPDEERAVAQELLLHVSMSPLEDSAHLNDDISRTIDYHAVAIRIEEVAQRHPRKLIETLAEDIACEILADFCVSRITVEIEKFILPNTSSVGVKIVRGG